MIALAFAVALAMAPARAEEGADEEPAVVEAVADPAPLLACLATADRAPEAERACVGIRAQVCIDGLDAAAGAPALAACGAAEAAAWDEVAGALTDEILGLIRFQADGEGGTDGGADGGPEATLLVDSQTAWAAFRDADCAQEAAHWGDDPMGEAALAECRLDRNATRALQLLAKRRMWENP